MKDTDTRDAKIQLTDVALSLFVLVGIIVTAPFWYKFIDMINQVADPFSSLLLSLVLPLLLIALIMSIGVSARRRV